MDHQWLVPYFTCVLTHAGQLVPVAQPGCPVDHIQTLVNRSPGDLWRRMYRHHHVLFCAI